MEHHFNVDIARKHGVDVAIFLQNISFWTLKNIANKKHYHDGRYWVYNTQEAWTILFPYWTRQNIRTIVKNCIDQNLIQIGRYNKKNTDKTTWYALTDFGLKFFPSLDISTQAVDKSVDNYDEIVRDSPYPWLELTNRLVSSNQALPDSNPDSKQSIYNSDHFKNKKITPSSNQPKSSKFQKSVFSDPTKQSTSYKKPDEEEKMSNPELVRVAMMSIPRTLRPKRYRRENRENIDQNISERYNGD